MKSVEKKDNGCWEWMGHLDKGGYGRITVRQNNKAYNRGVHRTMYELKHGAIQDGLFACHKCDNAKCCNPDHIFLGTHQDNMDDKLAKGHCIVPPGAKAGEKNGRSKLTQEMVNQIRERYAKGLKYGEAKEMAEEFGIAYVTLNGIINGRTWK